MPGCRKINKVTRENGGKAYYRDVEGGVEKVLKVTFPMIYGKRKLNAVKQGNTFLRHTQFAASAPIMYMPVRNDRMQEDNTSDKQKQDIFGFEHFTKIKYFFNARQ